MFPSERRIWHHARSAGPLALLALVAACADLLGFEPYELAGPQHRTDGGSGGGAGADERASAGVPSGETGGAPIGGASGDGGGAGSDGGLGGSAMGGRSPTPEWPRQGDPCSVRDAFACPGPAANWRLKCNSATWEWEFYDECYSTQRCNREQNTCETMRCNPDEDPSSLVDCLSSSVADWCGPDYVTLEFERCDFRCVEDQGCVQPDGDAHVYVDRPRHGVVGGNLWPSSTIPVCLEEPDAWAPEDIAAIEDAFYRTWGRYAAIGLTGFGPCEATSEGVALERAEDCSVELARVPSTGFPGSGSFLPVTLCKSYFDAGGDSRMITPSLFQLAAVHAFGHVIGHDDGSGVMTQIVDLDSLPDLVIDSSQLAGTLSMYGATPRGSLRDSSARCLGSAGASTPSSLAACDGSVARSFRLADGRLEHVGTGECFVSTGSEAVTLGSCENPDRWQALRAQWRTFDGSCISAGSSSPALVNKACSPEPTADHLWSFEFPSSDRVRIRSVEDGRCVRRPLTWAISVFAELGACDDGNDLFDTSRGELSVGGRCLDAPSLAFKVCSGSYAQRFALSGPLESQAGALTAAPSPADDEVMDLRVTPIQGAPTSAQTFELYF